MTSQIKTGLLLGLLTAVLMLLGRPWAAEAV